MLSVGGGAGAAVEAGVRVGWSGFGQLVPLVASGDVSLIGGAVWRLRGGVLRRGVAWPVRGRVGWHFGGR